MKKFYLKLSKLKKTAFILSTLPLSALLGAILGLIIGLISTTFMPLCCNENGCHNCIQFNGHVGYEATGIVGFYAGAILIPIAYITLIIFFEIKNKK